MNEREATCRLALKMVKGLCPAAVSELISAFGTAHAVFENADDLKSKVNGISNDVVERLKNKNLFKEAEREVEFSLKNNINIIIENEAEYPSRLRECQDAPDVLFFKGNADLNNIKVVSIVGTRNATDYGKTLCARFVRDLAELCPNILIISGLAYGIDIEAHRAAIEYSLPTVAVLAHGLDRIYPSVHRTTASAMQANGGIITEYMTETRPDRQNFIARNRIVAGMADATVVIESAIHGGALITANYAVDYGRDCYAFPGRVGDDFSAGCNHYISINKAGLIQSAADFVKSMMWDVDMTPGKNRNIQHQLFVELTPEEERIVELLRKNGDMQINSIVLEASISVNKLIAIMFSLEMKGIVKVLAGNVYRLL